jgi:hypothetical protein
LTRGSSTWELSCRTKPQQQCHRESARVSAGQPPITVTNA